MEDTKGECAAGVQGGNDRLPLNGFPDMLLSDMWQPAVLQLLPFSSNDACNPQSPSPGLHSLPTPDHSRGFPVLAVTRNSVSSESASSGGGGANGHSHKGLTASFGSVGGSNRHKPPRVLSERSTRSQARTENNSGPAVSVTPRAKSDYLSHRSGMTASSGKSNGSASQSREHATCTFTDMSEKVMRGQGTSPDSGTGSVKNSPFPNASDGRASHGGGGGGGGGGGSGQSSAAKASTSSFSPNALSPGNNAAASVIGPGANGSNNGGEGRFSSKNGLWKSVNLTPGEQELKKHREQLDHGSSETKKGRRYHKLNVRDLPRSTTPLNDHDPDKLNMKQVIAFLQTKGKSQAASDAAGDGSRSGQVRVKVNNHDLSLPGTAKSGVMRGSVRRTAPSSTTAELCLRAAGRLVTSAVETGGAGGSSGWPRDGAVSASAGDGSLPRSSSSPRMPQIRSSTADRLRTPGSRRSTGGGGGGRDDRHDAASESSPRKVQRKPFRLHRFLTMVPSPRDPEILSALAYSTDASHHHPHSRSAGHGHSNSHAERPESYYRDPEAGSPQAVQQAAARCRQDTAPAGAPGREYGAISKSAHKERTLCLDLASQSKSQAASQSKPEHSKSNAGHHHHHHKQHQQQQRGGGGSEASAGGGGGGGQNGSVPAESEGKVQYRLSAARPRPSSLRVEQDAAEARLKLSADFGEREYAESRAEPQDGSEGTDDAFARQEKNVIRLPFVLVDSEDEDAVGDHRPKRQAHHAKSKQRGSAKSVKSAGKAPQPPWLRLEKTKTKASRAAEGKAQGEGISSNSSNNNNHKTIEAQVPRVKPKAEWSSHAASASHSVYPGGPEQNSSSVEGTFDANSDSVIHWSTAASREDEDESVVLVDHQQRQHQPQPRRAAERQPPLVEEGFLPAIGHDDKKSVVFDAATTDNNSNKRNSNTQNSHGHKTSNSKGKVIAGDDKKQPKVTAGNPDGGGATASHQSVPKKVKVNVPRPTTDGDDHACWDDVTKPPRPPQQQQEYAVTLSLRKERHKTRERTYMSEIAGSDVLSDDTCAARVNSDSVRPSLRSDDTSSWTSSKC